MISHVQLPPYGQLPHQCIQHQFLPLSYLHHEVDYEVTDVRVDVVEVLDHTLGPLQAVLGECAAAVEGHHSRQVVQVLCLLLTHLSTHVQVCYQSPYTFVNTCTSMLSVSWHICQHMYRCVISLLTHLLTHVQVCYQSPDIFVNTCTSVLSVFWHICQHMYKCVIRLLTHMSTHARVCFQSPGTHVNTCTSVLSVP